MHLPTPAVATPSWARLVKTRALLGMLVIASAGALATAAQRGGTAAVVQPGDVVVHVHGDAQGQTGAGAAPRGTGTLRGRVLDGK
ncbi:MAG: hypothetical protein H0V80_08845 [Acidobacteria bacterium]|nr:hypothetical protein [Acidobacteriota bacterium]